MPGSSCEIRSDTNYEAFGEITRTMCSMYAGLRCGTGRKVAECDADFCCRSHKCWPGKRAGWVKAAERRIARGAVSAANEVLTPPEHFRRMALGAASLALIHQVRDQRSGDIVANCGGTWGQTA